MTLDFVLNNEILFQNFFYKKFNYQAVISKNNDDQQKREATLLGMIRYLEDKPHKYQGFKSTLYINLFESHLAQKKSDSKLLIHYLQQPYINLSSDFNQTRQQQLRQAQKNKQFVNQQGSRMFQTVVPKYLESILEKGEDYQQFCQYYQQQYVLKLYYKVNLFKGAKMPDAIKIFGLEKLKALNQMKILEFNDKGKQYPHGTPVKLSLSVKNISKLKVRVY